MISIAAKSKMEKDSVCFIQYLPVLQSPRTMRFVSPRSSSVCTPRHRRSRFMMNTEERVDDHRAENETQDDIQSFPNSDEDYIVDIEDTEFDDDDDLDVVNVPHSEELKKKKVRKNISDLVDKISMQPVSMFTSDADEQPAIEDDETTQYVRTVVRSIDERKGGDIRAFRVSKLSFITSFVVVAHGNNTPQMRAIGNLVEEDLFKQHKMHAKRKEGIAESGWILLDYGDFMVNIFSKAQRRNYNLEGLWRHAEELDVSDCISGMADEEPVEASGAALDDWLNE